MLFPSEPDSLQDADFCSLFVINQSLLWPFLCIFILRTTRGYVYREQVEHLGVELAHKIAGDFS